MIIGKDQNLGLKKFKEILSISIGLNSGWQKLRNTKIDAPEIIFKMHSFQLVNVILVFVVP